MNFAKKLFLGSVVAMSSFGLIACGDSSSSSGTEDQDQPENIVVPTQKDANITVSPDIGSSEAGNNMRFKGRFGLDITVDSLSETRDQIQFTKITYSVGKGNDINNMPPVNVTVQSNPITFPSGNDIDLNSQVPGIGAGVIIDMNDPGFTECGTYSLIVTVNASDDPVNAPEKFSRTEVIPFERNPNMFCRELLSSSSAEPVKQEVAMTSCVIEGLSTNIAPGINFATCQPADAATGDIVFAKAGTRDEPDMSVSGNNGIVFVELGNHIGDVNPEDFADNYDADSWPEDVNGRSAYVSDFKPRTIEKATLNALIENGSTIYIAKNPAIFNAETGAGMYPFAITYYKEGNNGDFNFSVKIYKVQ
jgi:hypothetical protein